MYAVGITVVTFVVVQSLFFLIKSWKHGRELGIDKTTLKNTVISSAMFSIAPAISILVTVLALAGALGMVLPWIRLSVIGNLAYETVAAENTLSVFGMSLSDKISDPETFAAVAWVMTVGSIFPLVLLPFLCKKLQKKIGDVANKSEKNKVWSDIISAAAFIGIIAAFIARAIAGTSSSSPGDPATNAGVMSVCVLVAAMVLMVILNWLCKKFNLTKFEPFAMPIAMFGAMGVAMILNEVLPADIAAMVWR